VFGSWQNERAIAYRQMHAIPSEWGTAVSVVAMVFGNLGPELGHGRRVHARPGHGEKRFYGEFLMNAQGEDVVAGIRTPEPIERLKKASPRAWKELLPVQEQARASLPRHAGPRVHDRGRTPVDAAVPHRQAHGLRGRCASPPISCARSA
jgi:hypothetical protein